MLNKKVILSKEEDLKAYRYYKALARSVASKYGDEPILVKKALIGLAKALYLYKDEKHKFSTYATYFMKQEVERYLGTPDEE